MSKKIAVVTLLCAVVALVACRREERYYEPMKLGGDVPAMEEDKGQIRLVSRFEVRRCSALVRERTSES